MKLDRTKKIYIIAAIIAVVAIMLTAFIIYIASGANDRKTQLVVASSSASKVYDGKILKHDAWQLVSGKVDDGHTLNVEVKGERTEVGTSQNNFAATVTDSNGFDVTYLYDIVHQTGELVVHSRALSIESNSATKTYDATPLSAKGYKFLSGELLEGHTLTVSVFGERTLAGISDNIFSAVVRDSDGNDVTQNYSIEKNYGKLDVAKIKITLSTPSYQIIYDGTTLQPNLADWQIVSQTTLMDGHSINVVLHGSQTDVGVCPNAIAEAKITDSQGLDQTANYEITQLLGSLIVTQRTLEIAILAADYKAEGTQLGTGEWEYSTPMRPVEGHQISVVVWGKQTQDGKESNTYAEIVIKDQNGKNVTFNYGLPQLAVGGGNDGGNNGGGGESGKPKLYIKPCDIVEPYQNGKVLYAQNVLQGLAALLEQGFTYKAEVAGKQSSVGISQSRIVFFLLFDQLGVDVTDQYSLIFSYGRLHLYVHEISVTTQSLEKIYDGTPLTQDDDAVLEGELIRGHSLQTFAMSGSQLNAGHSQNSCKIVIFDTLGNDVTSMYNIERNYGTLTVLARQITVQAGSMAKTFDGTVLTFDGFEVISTFENPLAEGDRITVKIVGSQTAVGQSPNTVQSVIVVNTKGDNVTSNYAVEYLDGQLVITK